MLAIIITFGNTYSFPIVFFQYDNMGYSAFLPFSGPNPSCSTRHVWFSLSYVQTTYISTQVHQPDLKTYSVGVHGARRMVGDVWPSGELTAP